MGYLDFVETARQAVEAKVWERFGFVDAKPYWEQRIGLKFRTVHRWLAIGDAVHRLPEAEQPELREALARLGSHKAGVLAPILGRDGEDWRAWVELAEGATESQLQGSVSEATGARPRGLTEPGGRFLRAILAAVPPERAGQVEAVFVALMKAGEMTNPVAAFLVMVDLAQRDLADQGVEVEA